MKNTTYIITKKNAKKFKKIAQQYSSKYKERKAGKIVFFFITATYKNQEIIQEILNNEKINYSQI